MATASGSSSSECEVFIVANGTQIDEDIFKMWLQGYSGIIYAKSTFSTKNVLTDPFT